MAYAATVQRSPRALVYVQADLYTEAARYPGMLSDLVHNAIVIATKAAENGCPSLPPARPAQRRRRGEGLNLTALRYTAPVDEQARCERALAAVGSSPSAIAEAALQAHIDAEGSRVDTITPGEAWLLSAAGAA